MREEADVDDTIFFFKSVGRGKKPQTWISQIPSLTV